MNRIKINYNIKCKINKSCLINIYHLYVNVTELINGEIRPIPIYMYKCAILSIYCTSMSQLVGLCIYNYMYIYIYRERERLVINNRG